MAEILRRPTTRRRLTPALVSGAAHAALIAAIIFVQPGAQPPPEPPMTPIPVMLAPAPPEPEPPAPKPEPKPPAPKAEAKAPVKKAKVAPPKKAPEKPPPPKRIVAKLKPAPAEEKALPAAKVAGYGYTEASDAQVAGASAADGGGGGGGGAGSGSGCNMARRLQAALRKDRMAQTAMAEAHRGRPILMWNGAWVRHPSQEGAGLASVREAIVWEVGFAPEACRREQVHGMIMISMNDRPGGARLMVGQGQWRWSDLLFTSGVVRR